MPSTRTVTERSRRLNGAFPFENAIAHGGASLTRRPRLTFTTPAATWSYAVSLPARWPAGSGWIATHDGVIRVRLDDVQGVVSVIAVDADGTVIDEVRLSETGGTAEADLVSAPLGLCHTVVLRNARVDGETSHAAVEHVECIDVGPSQDGDRLTAPDELKLRAVKDWPRYYGGEGRSLTERVRSVRYARLEHVKPMPWLERLQVHIYPNDDLSRALYISGLYEPSTLLVLQRVLRPGATFLDVGANAGLYSMLVSRWVGAHGHVYAFEPSEREYARLIDHLTLNDLQNVSARRQAVGSEQGAAQLRIAHFPNAGHNTLGASFAYPLVQTERIETVETVTLNAFVRAQGIERVDAIKMDIEGSEYAALTGALEVLDRFRPTLIVEVSRSALARCGSTPEQVIDLLKARRYDVYRFDSAADLVPLEPGESPPDGNIAARPVEAAHI